MNHDELNRNSPLSPSSFVAAAAALPPEAINLYAGLLAAPAGSPINIFAANQLLAARLNSTTANFYPHSLFPWQMPPIANSPPISPISPVLSAKKINNNNNNNIVTTTTANKPAAAKAAAATAAAIASNEANDLEINHKHLDDQYDMVDDIGKVTTHSGKMAKRLSTRKSNNFRKKRNQILYQPYTNLETSPTAAISPEPQLSPPTSGLSGSSPQSIGSSLVEHQSPSPNKDVVTTITTTTTTTNARDKSFTCLTCNRSFGYKHVLQNHERTHTGEKPFACLECDKRFTRDHHLKTHMRLHTGEKPYHCDHCDRKFVQVANLRRHLRVHTGEKPYACNRCDAKYSDSNQLKTHMIVHKDEKPFACATCSASFRRSHHLANHKCANAPLTPATSPVAISMESKSMTSRSEVAGGGGCGSSSERSLDLSGSHNATDLFKHFKLNRQSLSAMVPAQTHQALQQIYESTLSTIIENSGHELPLDLSVETSSENSEKRNSRKSTDPRHILRAPKSIKLERRPTSEQTEPEDLRIHSPRFESPLLSEEDLDDLDDAEALNRKQQQQVNNQMH